MTGARWVPRNTRSESSGMDRASRPGNFAEGRGRRSDQSPPLKRGARSRRCAVARGIMPTGALPRHKKFDPARAVRAWFDRGAARSRPDGRVDDVGAACPRRRAVGDSAIRPGS